MNIVFCFTTLELGGAEKQGLLFAKWLREERGCQVRVVSLGCPGRASDWCDVHSIPWEIVPSWSRKPWKALISLLRIVAKFRKYSPDIIISYTYPANATYGLVWRLTGAKKFIWNQRDAGLFRGGRFMEKIVTRMVPCFISNSEHATCFIEKEMGVAKQYINVIRNAVEVNYPPRKDYQSLQEGFGVIEGQFVACMIANLHDKKDHDTVLRAWKLVVDYMGSSDLPPVLILAGRDAGTGVILKEKAKELNISDNVIFAGFVEDIYAVLGFVDLGIFSSLSEGSPNGVLECMASALPVVATDIPAMREIFLNNSTKQLVAQQDYVGMAKAIISFINDHDFRYRVGQENLQVILKNYNTGHVFEQAWTVINQ